MSIMMPPSTMDCPRALWPAPRIETLSLFCAAYLTTACNAASVFGRAICATFAWTMRPQSVMSRPETMGKSAGMPFTVALLFPPIWGIAPVHRTVLAGATFGQRIRRPRPTSRGIAAAMLLEELQQTGEDVDVTVLAHEHVLMAVVRKHVQLVAAGNDFLQTLVAHDVRVGEHMVLLAGHEQDRRVDVLGIVHIVVRERFVFGIPRRVLHRSAVREHHLHHVPVVMHGDSAVQVSAAPVGDVVQVLVPVQGGETRAPHEAEHVTLRHVAFPVHGGDPPGQQLPHREPWLAAPIRVHVFQSEDILEHEGTHDSLELGPGRYARRERDAV